MGKQMRKSPWLRRSLVGFVLGLALVPGLPLRPSVALAQSQVSTDHDFIKACKDFWDFSSKIGGFISKGAQAYDFAVKALQFFGILAKPVSLEDIKAEMERIAQYQDAVTKGNYIADADSLRGTAYDDITEYPAITLAANFDANSPLYTQIQGDSDQAARQALAAASECLNLPIFQKLSTDPNSLENYDWRPGMAEALSAIATRLMAISVLDRNFKTDGNYNAELNTIRDCLTQHRNLIHPPRPFAFCTPMIGAGQLYACSGQLQCGEFRPWVGWQVDQSVVPFPLCDDYLRGTLAGGWVPSYASQVAFADLEAIVASKIDHDNLPVIFALQRLIDSIDIITSGQPDLTEKTPKIPFGANTGLCLSLKHPSGQGIWVPSLDSCSSTSPLLNWSYDRASGEITNVNTGLCLGVQGALTLSAPNGAIQVVACTNTDPTLVSDELQVWDWNPESGVIKNPLGPVLAVTDAIPQVGSLVSAAPANPWHLNQYVWTNGVSSSCSPAVCPAPGLAAWKQGPIPGTTQVYPKDFNIFAYVGASVTNTDVAGPVAAWKGITAQSFSINAANHMPDRPPVALVAGLGNLGLFVGGSEIGIMYAGPKQSDLDGNVNIASSVWLNPAATVRNPNPTRTNPINFEMAFENLQGMSTALTKYPAVGTVRPGVTMQLNSGSSKLAVFYVNGSDLSNARTIQFIVPASATVLINVSGTQVAIQNVGIISGQLDPSNMLWNFYEATSLKMSSITLPGSVLAPLAAAELSWGAVNGTMAAWSVNTTSQFHWCPFHNNALVAGP